MDIYNYWQSLADVTHSLEAAYAERCDRERAEAVARIRDSQQAQEKKKAIPRQLKRKGYLEKIWPKIEEMREHKWTWDQISHAFKVPAETLKSYAKKRKGAA